MLVSSNLYPFQMSFSHFQDLLNKLSAILCPNSLAASGPCPVIISPATTTGMIIIETLLSANYSPRAEEYLQASLKELALGLLRYA
jgi:hypothetical protein